MLYLLRHGKTDWNNERRIQGRTDIPLNEEGVRMAEEAAEKCADVQLDVCFCSPLKRARETADIIAGARNIEIIEDDRLMEMSFGTYEGENNLRYPLENNINVLFTDPARYVPPAGGESFEELFKRTKEFIEDRVKPLVDEGRNVLVVAHWAVNSSIICQMRGEPLKEFWEHGRENCELIEL